MKDDLLKIILFYGVIPQLKYFQSEVFELNEAIIRYEELNNHIGDLEVYDIDETELKKEHIAEEIADCEIFLRQFREYYNISENDIENIIKYKIDRTIKRMEVGYYDN